MGKESRLDLKNVCSTDHPSIALLAQGLVPILFAATMEAAGERTANRFSDCKSIRIEPRQDWPFARRPPLGSPASISSTNSSAGALGRQCRPTWRRPSLRSSVQPPLLNFICRNPDAILGGTLLIVFPNLVAAGVH